MCFGNFQWALPFAGVRLFKENQKGKCGSKVPELKRGGRSVKNAPAAPQLKYSNTFFLLFPFFPINFPFANCYNCRLLVKRVPEIQHQH